MTAIASLYNIPAAPEDLAQWSFAHAAHHRDIIRVIQQLGGPNLTEYILDPMNPYDPGVWTYQHQAAHDDFDKVLGIASSDLTDIDWSDQSKFAGWIQLNASEHYLAAQILGIG